MPYLELNTQNHDEKPTTQRHFYPLNVMAKFLATWSKYEEVDAAFNYIEKSGAIFNT
jgi:hypothetical protein